MTYGSDSPIAPSVARGVFVIGVHRRCGSNFLGDALRLCPDFQEPDPLAEDYLLEHAPLLVEYAERTAEGRYRKRFARDEDYQECRRRLLRRIGDGLVGFLRDHVEPGRRLLTRTPDPDNLDRFFDLFPDSLLVLLVRDGRDVVESSAKSWPGEPYSYWMRAWSYGARRMLDFMGGAGRARPDAWKLVRYEDLLAGRAAVEDLLRFVGVDPAGYPWDRFEALPLRGSSTHRGGREELHWQPVERPKDFKPVGRWQSWSWWRKRQFQCLAGRESNELGYATQDAG